MALSNGEKIAGRYVVEQRIGEGGMSNIYLVRSLVPVGDAPPGRWVIKEMSVAYRDTEDQRRAVELFEREAELLKQLRHKNLPRVVDKFVVENRYYTVMEYVEGEDLGKMILRNPGGFAEAKVIAWGIEIATVLYYLHSQKPPIIFRDLKPSNIMISRGQVRLIDFGIARRFDPFKKKDTMRIGSPGYAPPEQYSGQTDRRSDIYALGVTMHQLLTGRDPSETQTPFKLPSVRALKPTVSPALEAIIMQATELDPQKRFKTALDMKRALQTLIGVQSGPLPATPGASTTAGLPRPQTPPAPSRPPAPAQAPPRPVISAVPPRLGPPAIAAPPPVRGSEPARPSNPYSKTASSSPSATPAAPPPPSAAPSHATPPMQTVSPSPAPSSSVPSPASPVVPPHVYPHQKPGAPKSVQKASLGPFLFILAMLAFMGFRYHVQIVQWTMQLVSLVRPAAPSPTPPPLQPSPSPAVPTDATWRALSLEDEGKNEAALDLLDDVRQKEPQNPLAMIAWNNGLVASEPQAAAALSVLLAVYENDARGDDWLRGVALAQRDINAEGGAEGHRLVLVPVPVAAAAFDADAVVKSVTERHAVAVLADVAAARGDALATALARSGVPLLSLAPRVDVGAAPLPGASASPGASPGSGAVLPSWIAIAHAVAALTPELKATRVLIMANTDAERAAASVLEGDLRKSFHRGSFDVKTSDAADAVTQAGRMHADLVVDLGDAATLEPFAVAARAGHLTVNLVTPFMPRPADDSALAECRKNGHLFVVTPFATRHWMEKPLAASADVGDTTPADLLDLAYRRAYDMSLSPLPEMAQGYSMLRGFAQALAGTTQWTLDSVRGALAAASGASLMGGVVVGTPASGLKMTWYLIKLQSGTHPSVLRAVTL